MCGWVKSELASMDRTLAPVAPASRSSRCESTGGPLPGAGRSDQANPNVRFSNRPFGVKRFQTIRRRSVDVAHGLVLLFGIGTKAFPSWDSRTRWNNLWVDLVVSVTAGQADMRTHLIHRPARDIIPPLGGAR